MPGTTSVPALGVLALGALLGSCGSSTGAPPVGPNLLLITVDTLRADSLGTYGAGASSSPALDLLASQSVVFEDAQAHSSWTLPSFASLHTSLDPSAHGCTGFDTFLDPSFTTLAETLVGAGWDTAAVVSHVFLGRDYGLHQGFVHFDDELVMELHKSDEAISSPRVSDKGVAFVEAKAAADDGRPWFLWLHYFDPHVDYLVHPGFEEGIDPDDERAVYQGEVAFTDHHIGRVLEALRAGGQAGGTVVAFTSDHGEEFGEHGGRDHGHTLHQELLRLPLFIRAPGLASRRVSELVRGKDIAPTLLDLLGLSGQRAHSGESLVELMRAEERSPRTRMVLSELSRSPARRYQSLISGQYKLVLDQSNDSVQLYDRTSDVDEQQDLSQQRSSLVSNMRRSLAQALDQARTEGAAYRKGLRAGVGAAERAQLADLGYSDGEQDE